MSTSVNKTVMMNNELVKNLVSVICKTNDIFSKYSQDELSKLNFFFIIEYRDAIFKACVNLINDICHQTSEIKREVFNDDLSPFDEPSVTLTYIRREEQFRMDVLNMLDNCYTANLILQRIKVLMSKYPEYFQAELF